MSLFGQNKWRFVLAAIVAALLCCSSPVLAASSSTAKSKPAKEKTVKEKPAKDTKADKKKAEPKKAETKKPESKKADDKKKETKKAEPKKTEKKVQDKKKPVKKAKSKHKSSYDDTASDEIDVEDVAPAQTDDTATEAAPADSTTKKVTIQSDDPKAFTKALLYEKEGVEVEIVDAKAAKKEIPKIGFDKGDYFDFSTMLVPVTHESRLGSPYGIRDHRLHRGVDIHVEKGEPMLAAYPGKVVVSKYNKGGYGHYVVVEHEGGLQTLYGHLAERAVRVGDIVFPGDIVGLAGNTGKSSGAHLHFEIRYKDININPASVVNFPKWELQPGVERMSKKKIVSAHYNMQNKLKKENLYIVKAGDTLKDVANYFYISEDAVCRINGLKKDQPLRVGQRLKGSK